MGTAGGSSASSGISSAPTTPFRTSTSRSSKHPDPSPVRRARPPERRMSKTILLAEDERMLRESLAQLLGEEGYQVVQAADGKEAYDALLIQPFDLILTDIRMPNMDGVSLLQHAQQAAP